MHNRTVEEVAACTAKVWRIPSPDLVGFLCVRALMKGHPKSHEDLIRGIGGEMHRLFPLRVLKDMGSFKPLSQ